ncbi:hypothetical protein [Shinella zoogloeoides]|uniref:hypothetical protein n=1 Tax=Shinella zoogloeoides TaxID=352475 RepID=UPI00273F1914|nr:hypothetical protein [Shinella zoogloeoides]WLR92918.1 hypothetical protein Q9316_01540 [Shinella zoogloeoides]
MHHPSKSQQTRIRQMANAMRELGDDCTIERLIRLKFTRREISIYGTDATEMANADSVRAGKLAA